MTVQIDYQRHEKERAGPENAAALFVSLYVVVLAFFILLTSNAQFDAEKTKNVTDSVKRAFSIEVPTDVEVKTPSLGSELSVQQFFNEVQTAVHSIVPLEEMEVVTDGRNMTMTMDSTALFNRDDPSLRPDRREFYARLSDTMTKWRGGMQMNLDFLQGVPRPTGGVQDAATLQVTRAGNFARFMENRGAEPKSLNIAIEQGLPDKVIFVFEVTAFDASKLDFGKPETEESKPQTIRLNDTNGGQP